MPQDMNVILIPVQGDHGSGIRQKLATWWCSSTLLGGVNPLATNTEIFSLSRGPRTPRDFLNELRSFRQEIYRFKCHEIDIEDFLEQDLPQAITRKATPSLRKLQERARKQLIWVPVYSGHLPAIVAAVRRVFPHLAHASPETEFVPGTVLHFNAHGGETIDHFKCSAP